MKKIKLKEPFAQNEMKNLDILRQYIDKDLKVVKNNGTEIEGVLRTMDVGPTLFIKQIKGEGCTVHITDIKELFSL